MKSVRVQFERMLGEIKVRVIFRRRGSSSSRPSAGAGGLQPSRRLEDFLAECCVIGRGRYTRASDLRSAWERWTGGTVYDSGMTLVQFNVALRRAGLRYSRSRRDGEGVQFRSWEGLSLKPKSARRAA